MGKEKVKLIDGTEKEVEIHRLGFRAANKIAKKHLPINDLTFNKQTDDITIKGDIDLFGMAESCMDTIKDLKDELDKDQIASEEANRIYKKFFEKDVMAGLGQGGNPN